MLAIPTARVIPLATGHQPWPGATFRWALKRWPTAALAAALLIFALLGTLGTFTHARLDQAAAERREAYEVLLRLERAMLGVKASEASKRAFLLTGERQNLDQHLGGLADLRTELGGLVEPAIRNLGLGLKEVEPVVRAKLVEIDRMIGMDRRGAAQVAVAELASLENRGLAQRLDRRLQRSAILARERIESQTGELLAASKAISLLLALVSPLGFVLVVAAGLVVNAHLAARVRAEASQRDSGKQLRLALSAGRMGTWRLDLRRHVSSVDAVQASLLGLPEGTTTASEEAVYACLHPDDRAAVQSAVEQAVATGEEYQFEFRVVQPDGAVRWLSARGAARYDETGQPVELIGVDWDITERKTAEQRQVMLTRELKHRVRNTLAVIQGIARMTGRTANSLDGFLHTFDGRLQALGAANDLVTGTGGRDTRLAALLERTLQPHGVLDLGRFELRVTDVPINAALTQNLALALHELATNAVKHGALSVPWGRVVIEAAPVADDGSRLRLLWREIGGPPASVPERQGFGTQLLRQLLAGQEGRLEHDWHVDGLVCTLELPLTRAAGEAAA
jgi:two-component sensor histidine kinase/PAS domain-containing protein